MRIVSWLALTLAVLVAVAAWRTGAQGQADPTRAKAAHGQPWLAP